ncbi:MAG: sulfotransferase [Parafilimonas sp.]
MNFVERSIKSITTKGITYIKKRTLKKHPPAFIIAGAQKSGTSSLHYYLSQHPNLLGSTPKEVRYFDRDDNFRKGKKWYHRSFVNLHANKKDFLCFEATPEYLYRSYVPQRIHQEYPHLKIIIILRDPVKRAYSAWNMYKHFFKVKRIPQGYVHKKENNLVTEFFKADKFPLFEEAIASEILKIENNSTLEEPGLLRRGIYMPQIKRYHDLFGKDHVLILGMGDLNKNKKECLNNILRFLNLKESEWNFLPVEKRNTGSYSEQMNIETKEKLYAFFESHNNALFKYLGTNINW